MPIDPVPPCYTEIFTRTHRDAADLLNKAIYLASGDQFKDLPTPPPLKAVLRAYTNVMGVHVAEVLLERSAAFAERAAQADNMHAAELQDKDGHTIGFTTYSPG